MYGEKIRVIRELRGFFQEHMASEPGIAQTTYSKIETNQSKLTAETLQKVAEVFRRISGRYIEQQPTIVNFELIKARMALLLLNTSIVIRESLLRRW